MASAGLERTPGALPLNAGDPLLAPHQTMISARAFDSQLTPQGKHSLYTKSTRSVGTPSLLEVLCSAEPLRAVPGLGMSQGGALLQDATTSIWQETKDISEASGLL